MTFLPWEMVSKNKKIHQKFHTHLRHGKRRILFGLESRSLTNAMCMKFLAIYHMALKAYHESPCVRLCRCQSTTEQCEPAWSCFLNFFPERNFTTTLVFDVLVTSKSAFIRQIAAPEIHCTIICQTVSSSFQHTKILAQQASQAAPSLIPSILNFFCCHS